MVLFVIVNNNTEKKFLEAVVAENIEELLPYVDEKYGTDAQPLGQDIVYDIKGNLVGIELVNLIKEEYRNK